ncbi:gamma-glutamyl-gamma-aminobutyrate hydrolase family protein [Kroppenstedtia pulmonis]|uniref:Gamma-glutamyl-gamma-aminobutyrate hydrolase family protein n=1 Tax=Kroppenstedtia pulmonis TaxID=1380685 RepID=A0A7D4CGA9_9BACL|nr:gamma-glutamyl-gamma-aminobutyrate hydrolase family protein [Kroppenstedtia pulmonis]QKG84834.1 gamma-glutamyl-gamma-aminobutyrate hydrolase family protein [Kroppenstedtia pulmonis]
MRPLIGVSLIAENEKYMVNRDYAEAVFRAGGWPVLLPFITEEETIVELAGRLDGLLLTGGDDIDPGLFGEDPMPGLGQVEPERDQMELILSRVMMDSQKPILAICRGCQILNIAAGGDMYQDLEKQRKGIQHAQIAPRSHASHRVKVEPGTLFHRLVGGGEYRVNSFHHQAVRQLAPDFMVAATAPDGIIEAFESRNHPFILGVQWHPEGMKDKTSDKMFASFVAACQA